MSYQDTLDYKAELTAGDNTEQLMVQLMTTTKDLRPCFFIVFAHFTTTYILYNYTPLLQQTMVKGS